MPRSGQKCPDPGMRMARGRSATQSPVAPSMAWRRGRRGRSGGRTPRSCARATQRSVARARPVSTRCRGIGGGDPGRRPRSRASTTRTPRRAWRRAGVEIAVGVAVRVGRAVEDRAGVGLAIGPRRNQDRSTSAMWRINPSSVRSLGGTPRPRLLLRDAPRPSGRVPAGSSRGTRAVSRSPTEAVVVGRARSCRSRDDDCGPRESDEGSDLDVGADRDDPVGGQVEEADALSAPRSSSTKSCSRQGCMPGDLAGDDRLVAEEVGRRRRRRTVRPAAPTPSSAATMSGSSMKP